MCWIRPTLILLAALALVAPPSVGQHPNIAASYRVRDDNTDRITGVQFNYRRGHSRAAPDFTR